MRINLRLHGQAGGRKCSMDASIYSASAKQFRQEVDKAAGTGPWLFLDTKEPVPEGATILIEHVEQLAK